MIQLKGLKLEDVIFIDTETARLLKELKEGTPTFDAWDYMTKKESERNEDFNIFEDYKKRAGLYAEFSRLVCITVGRFKEGVFNVTTYRDEDEALLLKRFNRDLDAVCSKKPNVKLCGHSVKGFDIPFMFRRGLVHRLPSNRLIDVGGAKPWELDSLDTKDLWKGTGYYPASLVAVCLALGIPSPKSDINGSQVGDVYHEEGEAGVDRIVKYCERDVVAVANVLRAWRNEDLIEDFVVNEPRVYKPLGLMERIGKEGVVSPENEVLLLERVVGQSIAEKEKSIKVLKSALLITGGELSQELELKILGA